MTDLAPVLLVDDEASIRDLLQLSLEEGGYAVTIAESGAAAMAILNQTHAQCLALITDVDMGPGGPKGWEVAKHARELNPDMPVIYMTGASGHEWEVNGVPNSMLLVKPFAPAQVVTAVSQLLNAAGSSSRQP
jgi:DNA-binding NtrC family response regulator